MDFSDGIGGSAGYRPLKLLLSGTVPVGSEALFRSILAVAHAAEFPITLVHGAHPSVVPLIGPEWKGRDRAIVFYSSERWPAPSGPHGPGVRVPQVGTMAEDLEAMRRQLCRGIDRMLCFGGIEPERRADGTRPDSGIDAESRLAEELSGSRLQRVHCGWFGGAATALGYCRSTAGMAGYEYLTEEEAALIAADRMTDAGFAALRRWLTTP